MIELHLPSDVTIGGGAAAGLPDHVAGLGISRPLVVTDHFLLEHGPAGPLAERLPAAGVFADVQPDPTLANVHGALEAIRAHDADGVVGIGGGSPLDTAKAASVLAANDGDLRDWAGYHRIPGPGLPLVAVPTTAGTGSEVTRVAVITDTERDVKMMMLSNHLLPSAAVVDYELSLTAPAALSAHVGVDSLTHAIEAYVSTRANVVTDLFALKAAKLIGDHLRRAVADGSDREAREAMMLGATLAGAAFSNASVALVHGMSRPIGAHFHLAHGLSNAVLLPTVTRFSVPGAPERYATIAREMGLTGGADGLVEELQNLNRDLRIPTIGGAGVQRERFEQVLEEMAQAALDSGSPGFNPRPATAEEIVELYRKAF